MGGMTSIFDFTTSLKIRLDRLRAEDLPILLVTTNPNLGTPVAGK